MNINKQGKKYSFLSSANIINNLPVGNYMLMYSIQDGHYLEELPLFKLPTKIYGCYDKFVQKIIKRFSLGKTLGVHLTGEKGSGKTILSQKIAQEINLPVILINERFVDSDFISFITNIEQECVILLDEFDKHYRDESDQVELLQLLDCNFTTPKLFILTSNNNTTSKFLNNRPSRLFYAKDFTEASDALIKEILDDKLENKEFFEDCVNTISEFDVYNIDSILSLINEVNFCNEPASDVIKDMNLKVSESGIYNYFAEDNTLLCTKFQKDTWIEFEAPEHLRATMDLIDKSQLVDVYFSDCKFERISNRINHFTHTKSGVKFIEVKEKVRNFYL